MVIKAITLIEKILSPEFLAIGLLIPELIAIPPRGATEQEIQDEELRLGRSISADYRTFLRKWNGLNLDEIRFNGAGNVHQGIQRIWKADGFGQGSQLVAIASDPSGFVYAEDEEGVIHSLDHDGGDHETVALNFESFVVDFLFGKDSANFHSEEWHSKLKKAGITEG